MQTCSDNEWKKYLVTSGSLYKWGGLSRKGAHLNYVLLRKEWLIGKRSLREMGPGRA